ncbi:hypothetical protein GLYMA_01G223851v4 [Glycine max]|nr:hypothetical protein GLYMA_01G223851v4 [Glycine max]
MKSFFIYAVGNWDAEFYAKVNDDVYVNLGHINGSSQTGENLAMENLLHNQQRKSGIFKPKRPQTRNFRGSTCTRSKTHTTFCRAPNNNELSLRLPLRVQLPAATGIWIAGPPWLALPPPRS